MNFRYVNMPDNLKWYGLEVCAADGGHYFRGNAPEALKAVEAVAARTRAKAIRDASTEASLALLAMDGIEFTPEQHNSVVDAILALLDGGQ